ncbi:MAG: SDR family oxidoreductase [Gemmataceae bacterium]|nr:SDR family oxidoreductase [Planctomycetia bacterium]MBX3398956.1 SDR family oxidoreductase [Gemmataceae bacterium]
MKLLGKTALVTGAARGIGKGCAIELARAGANVAINDLTASPEAEATVAEIRAMGRQAVLIEGDVFERPSCESVAARAIEALGRLDLFVSNPAYSRRGDFLDYDPDLFERVLKGTLFGGFHMSQLVARHMVARGGGGKIVFVSSVHARIPFARSVAYNAAKIGLTHMARTIAAELLSHRINVNVIEPGWIDTPGEHATFGSDTIAQAGPTLPWGRLGQPEDIGRAAVFLCSDDADYITGTELVVDGGLCLRGAGGAGATEKPK